MKISMNLFAFLMLLCTLFCNFAQAQQDWGTVDPGKAKEEYAKLQDSYKAKQYADVKEALDWLLQNSPDHSESLYKMAIDCYQQYEKAETELTKKAGLRDRVMQLFDLRIEKKFYKDEADIFSRKGYLAYFYWIDRPDKVNELYDLYKKILKLNGDNFPYAQSTYLLDLACRKKTKNELTQDEVLAQYDELIAIADRNIAAAKDADKWTTTKDGLGQLLVTCVKIDCEFVKKNYGPKLEANPADAVMATKIIGYMLQGKCTEDPLFLFAAEKLYASNNDPALGYTIAKIYGREKKFDKVMEWYNKLVDKMPTPKDNSDIYLGMARINSTNNNKSEARKNALKAVEADKANASDAYELIGDLYMNSYEICKGGDAVEARAVFLIAYDMYAKAGASSKMNAAKGQFPSKEDCFTLNRAVGSAVSVGCWIGGSTTIRTR